MSINRALRFEIFKRDSFTCQYCGKNPPSIILEVDHIQPVSKGGTDEPENLITSCFDCNRGKKGETLNQVPQSLQDIKERDIKRREQVKEYNDYLSEKREQEELEINELGKYWWNHFSEEKERDLYVFGPTRIPTLRRFLREIPREKLKELMDIAIQWALSKDREEYRAFKYFCACGWNYLKQIMSTSWKGNINDPGNRNPNI